MQKFAIIAIIFAWPFGLIAQNSRSQGVAVGESAISSSQNATTLSMMGWGFGLAAGIAALCALVQNDTAHTHS